MGNKAFPKVVYVRLSAGFLDAQPTPSEAFDSADCDNSVQEVAKGVWEMTCGKYEFVEKVKIQRRQQTTSVGGLRSKSRRSKMGRQ